MRLLVCGGRDYKDKACVYQALARFRSESFLSDQDDVLISGAARGADTIAIEYANCYGLILKTFPADWGTYGKKAGYIRNVQMLKEGQPDYVIAFPGGKGTAMMVDLAQKAGVPVIHVGRDPLGNVVMGAKGSSSSLPATTKPGIKTKLFQQKYIDRIAALQMLTPGQHDGIYQEIAHEEAIWLQGQDQAALEYEEILNVQDMMDKLNAG